MNFKRFLEKIGFPNVEHVAKHTHVFDSDVKISHEENGTALFCACGEHKVYEHRDPSLRPWSRLLITKPLITSHLRIGTHLMEKLAAREKEAEK